MSPLDLWGRLERIAVRGRGPSHARNILPVVLEKPRGMAVGGSDRKCAVDFLELGRDSSAWLPSWEVKFCTGGQGAQFEAGGCHPHVGGGQCSGK